MKKSVTNRGFGLIEFIDRYGEPCNIQKSSLADEDAIWVGVANPSPQIMASDAWKLGVDTDESTGWIPYPLPKEVLLNSRMHLTREQVLAILPALQHFVDTGELPE